MTRRVFLGETARGASVATLVGVGLWAKAETAHTLPLRHIRPPGALVEQDFLAKCVRCGLCVRSCPYDTLRLGKVEEPGVVGTPFFKAREIPCEMCEDIPCVVACPTGALDKGLKNIEKAQMGLAVLADQETCLNFLGLRCEVCYRVCPVMDKAITLERLQNKRTGRHAMFIPVVHSDHCTGCGKCERACVLTEAAINILPIDLVKGKMGKHYRLGWVEKEKKGGPLAPNIINKPLGQWGLDP
ncbi:MAG: ferredoxin-type protein NapG [Magnetococcales bacterium]|nr:ferredoxin-type protein NapG [Magnetococcales bacterium]